MKIGYKVISAALAIAILAVMVFAPMVTIGAKSVAAQLLVYLAQVKDNEQANQIVEDNDGEVPDRIEIPVSIAGFLTEDSDLISAISELGDGDKTEAVKEQLQRFISPGVTFLISFALMAICAVVVLIFAIFAKDNRKVIFASMAGIGVSFVAKYSFEIIAEPFLTGKVTLASILQTFWAVFIGDIDKFELDTGFWVVPVIFGVIIVFTMLYNYTLPADQKKARREMLGEEIVEVKK